MFNHTISVTTHNGAEVRVINGRTSLNVWTRKDGGLTVRVDHSRTIRFDGSTKPVIKRHK